jgi:hypothetical protein
MTGREAPDVRSLTNRAVIWATLYIASVHDDQVLSKSFTGLVVLAADSCERKVKTCIVSRENRDLNICRLRESPGSGDA